MNEEQLKQRIAKVDNLQKREWKRLSNLNKKFVTTIHDMVKMMGGEVYDYSGDCPLITYDGGRHAEYASTTNASVTRIASTKNRKFKSFVIDIAGEEDNYSADRLNTADIGAIFDFVCEAFERFCKNKENVLSIVSMFTNSRIELGATETENLQLYDGVDEDGEGCGELHGVVAITLEGVEMDNGETWSYSDLTEEDFENILGFLEDFGTNFAE